jgi:pimeloyl-ACP methyl ester carboxylesterase
MTRYIHNGNVRIAIEEHGSPKNPPVVLVHGYPDCRRVWDFVVAEIADRFHVITYDVRGAGESSVPDAVEDYALDRLAADFRAVIDAVSPDRPVHVVGHDWGSIQSWEPVTDPALAPRIASFTTISGPCLDHVGYLLRDALRSADPRQWTAVVKQVAKSWYIFAFQAPGVAEGLWRAGLGKRWGKLLGLTERASIPREYAARNAEANGVHGIRLYRANVLQRLGNPRERTTQVPVQAIIPRYDPFLGPFLLRDLVRWAPNLTMVALDAGHWAPVTHPAHVAGCIAEFVDKLEHGRSAAQ